MMKLLPNKYLLLISGIVLGGVFIFAGMEKIADPTAFAKSIYNYKLFPQGLINLVSVIIPWIEVTAGILLIFNVYSKENAIILNALLLFFNIIVIISITRGLNIDCGCFGTAGGSKVGWLKILENSALFLFGLHIIFFSGIPSPESQSPERAND
jgi:putative oxidoreductase